MTSFRELLMRTGSLVKPIMKKHDWKVGTLAEVRTYDLSHSGVALNLDSIRPVRAWRSKSAG